MLIAAKFRSANSVTTNSSQLTLAVPDVEDHTMPRPWYFSPSILRSEFAYSQRLDSAERVRQGQARKGEKDAESKDHEAAHQHGSTTLAWSAIGHEKHSLRCRHETASCGRRSRSSRSRAHVWLIPIGDSHSPLQRLLRPVWQDLQALLPRAYRRSLCIYIHLKHVL